ncbi:MAG: hypothetical protein CL770_04380 [Chloroflexi bacterium]|nr:hypothetical protein [Chloroflexota bacterium]|tara:strand:+ start:17468 stop:18460 length:993 start_codon:yes stop_codon:yes gene_type:complete
MSVLYVQSTQKGSGKTAFCTSLAKLLNDQSKKSIVVKVNSDADEFDIDTSSFNLLLGQKTIKLPDLNNSKDYIKELSSAIKKLEKDYDVVIVEGSYHLDIKDATQLWNNLSAKIILIHGYELDYKIENYSKEYKNVGENLIGVLINKLPRYQVSTAGDSIVPSFESIGINCIGVVPENRKLVGISLDQLVSHIGGKYIIGEDFDKSPIESIVIGGTGLDSGEVTFSKRSNQAIVIRSDRPDIQMAALRNEISCLLVTDGLNIIEYVYYEAENQNVPIIGVEKSTIEIMETLSNVSEISKFDTNEKLDFSKTFFSENIDLDLICQQIGISS